MQSAGPARDRRLGIRTSAGLLLAGFLFGSLAGHFGLLDLGEHWLRDLSRPERVFQVVHPDLPASFPPLRATRRERDNLRSETTPGITNP